MFNRAVSKLISPEIEVLPTCDNPKYIKKLGIWVACGHCQHCKEKKKKEWITRLNCEYRTKKTGVFLTLTFNDLNIGNTSYDLIQRFIRRYKYYFKCNGIKYFGCFEKGDLKNRGHYHLLIFGHNPKLIIPNHIACNNYLAKIWKQGFVYAEYLNENTIKYVCQYVQKKQDLICSGFSRKLNSLNKYSVNDITFMLYAKQLFNVCVEEKETFLFQSKGLGFDFLFNNLKKILQNNNISLSGKNYPIPKGFLDRLRKIDNTAILQFFDDRRFNFLSIFYNLAYNKDPWEIAKIEEQIQNNIEEKIIQKNIIFQRQKQLQIDKKNSLYRCPF